MATRNAALLCTSALRGIGQLLAAVRNLKLSDLVNGTLLGLTNAIDELLRNTSHYPDPKLELEVEDLRQKLMELKTMITRRFIPGCKSVAKFAMRREQLQRICTDLRAGKAETLQAFLVTLGKRLSNCKERADAFEAEYKALQAKIGIAVEKHGGKQNKLKEDVETKTTRCWMAMAGGGLAVTAGALGAVSGGVGLVTVPVAYMIFSGGLLVGTAAVGTAGGISISLGFTKKDLDLMASVTGRILEMNQEMGKVHNGLDEILGDLESAEADLATEIKEGHSIRGKDIESIIEGLEEFRDSMEELVTTCDSKITEGN